MSDLRDNVKRMVQAGVPEEEIGTYIKRHSLGQGSAPQREQPKPMSWGEAGVEAAKNIPESFVNMAVDLGSAAIHPIDTLKGVYRLAKGASRAMDPTFAANADDKAAFASLAKFYSDRYGSFDGFKQALASDPVGILGDATVVIGGTGALARGVGSVAKLPRLARAGAVAKTVSEVADPLNIARQVIKAPARAIGATGIPERMYLGVVKPTKRIPSADRAGMFDVAMREKIVPREGGRSGMMSRAMTLDPPGGQPGGIKTVRALLNDQMGEVNAAVQAAEDAGGTVSRKGAVAGTIPLLEKQWTRSKRRAVANQVGEFIEDYPEDIRPTVAQKAKQDLYNELGDNAFDAKSLPGKKEAMEGFGLGLKKELEKLYPELENLNANAADMINLKNALSDAVLRLQNRSMVGLTDTVAMSNNPIFAIKAALGIPQVKARLGIALARARHLPNYKSRGPLVRGTAINEQRAEDGIPRQRVTRVENGKVKKVEVK